MYLTRTAFFFYALALISGVLHPAAAQAQPVASGGALATLTLLESASDEQVYGLVRAVFDNLDARKQSNPVLAGLQPAKMVKNVLSESLHPGALRYYRGKGWS
jgi:uncharacterized protein